MPFEEQLDRACRRCARPDDKICSDGDLRCKHCQRHAIVIAYYGGASGPCCPRHYRKSLKWTADSPSPADTIGERRMR